MTVKKTVNEISDILKIEGINCKGFGVIPKAIMLDLDLSIEAKTIYSYFCSLAGNGTTAFPSRDTIISHLKISKDFYYKNFKQLTDNGFIKVERVNDFPYNNIYTLINNPKKYEDKETAYNKPYSQIKYNGLKAHGFGTIPRVIMVDNRLDIKAKGIYSYFCSYAGSGISAFPKKDKILYHLRLSEKTYYKYYNQLISCNYITVMQRKVENGQFSVSDYYLNENPDIFIGEQIQADKIKKSYPQEETPYGNLQDNEENGLNSTFLPYSNLQDNGNFDLPYGNLPDNTAPDSTSPDSTGQDTIINSTTKNNITKNNQSINHESSRDRLSEGNIEIELSNYNSYRRIIAENIEYAHLKKYQYKNEEMLDEIYEILVEAVTTKKETIRVCGEDKPAAIVKSVLLKLTSSHIDYVITSLRNNVTKATNIEAYILTALYKAPRTISSYYSNLVQNDMYGYK